MIHLPIDDYLKEITESLNTNNQLILLAEPGAGKTTRVPPALLKLKSELTKKQKIIVLEPRRIAARAACERIADEQNWKVGQEIGYQVRLDNKTSHETQIIFMTEALLWKALQKDPILSDIGAIIFDEFHERNIYSDVSLAVLFELQSLERNDLKLILMSATLDVEKLKVYWPDSPVIQVPGRTYPVEVVYDTKPQILRTDYTFIERSLEKIKSVIVHKRNRQQLNKYILVFLPGTSEIQRIQKKLDEDLQLKDILILPLHGQLSLEDQKQVLNYELPSQYQSKVILATNIAESSLTIDGVDTVIDSGLARDLSLDPKRFYPILRTLRISKSSAEQRKGRAGRQWQGYCYRMWNKSDELTMPAHGVAELLKVDLTETILFLLTLNYKNPASLSWFESPPLKNMEKAISQLNSWSILNEDHSLNKLGISIAQWPLPPILGYLMEIFTQAHEAIWGAQIAALLLDKDPWRNYDNSSWQTLGFDSDLIPRLMELNESMHKSFLSQTHATAEKLCRTIGTKYQLKKIQNQQHSDRIHLLLLKVFQDSLCRRRKNDNKNAITISGLGISLNEKSLVIKSDFFVALSGRSLEVDSQSVTDLAIPIQKEWVFDLFKEQIEIKRKVEFEKENLKFFKIEQKFLKYLPLEEPQKSPCREDEIDLKETFLSIWPTWKSEKETIQQWYQRYNWAQKYYPDLNWKNLDIDFENELIEIAIMGANSIKELDEKNWLEVLDFVLTEPQRLIFKIELPTHIKTPNGKTFRLQYEEDVVNLSLKIQDAYGWKETPYILHQKVAVRLILLGPHMRPLQTTTDLNSFWKNTYQDLRPQLKAKYPKHAWPTDPSLLSK